jgi:hypothetical protein
MNGHLALLAAFFMESQPPTRAVVGTGFMSVMRTATATDARALSVLCVRVAEELSVFCPKTGFPTLCYIAFFRQGDQVNP